MKLMSILEDDNNQDQNLVDAYDRTKIIIGKFKKEIEGRYQTPDGAYDYSIMNVSQSSSSPNMELWGTIEINGTFRPNMNNLTLPLDMLSKTIDLVMDEIRNKFPELLNESIDVLNRYDVKIFGYYVKAGESHMGISEILGVALYNIKIRGFLEPLGELLTDRSRTELFKFAPIELPEFSKDFKAVHDQVYKSVKIVAKVYRKGTWKGHTYDLGEISDDQPSLNYIALIQNSQTPFVEDGVLLPSFKPHIFLRSPKIDGIAKWQGNQFPLTDDEYKEFIKYITKLFAKHGIVYM
jgi:hypothetical protein